MTLFNDLSDSVILAIFELVVQLEDLSSQRNRLKLSKVSRTWYGIDQSSVLFSYLHYAGVHSTIK